MTVNGTFFNSSTLEELHLDNTSLPINFLQNIGALSALKILSIAECDLHGTLPLKLQDHPYPNMANLDISNNNLNGQIPKDICLIFPNLRNLRMAKNGFTGMLPRWFGNSTSLEILDLSKNHFKGPIPGDFCKLDKLEYLDLSKNNLSGYIPSCFSPSSLIHVHLSENRLNGPLTYGFYNSSFLVTMDLRDNSFTGSIPNWIGNRSSLSFLLLRANHFDGELPVELCLLEELSILDVSQNQLSGPLPSCLGNLTFKESFPESLCRSNPTEFGNLSEILSLNLSHNNLTGSIPATFSNLKHIESLDLSYNNLNGAIPPQLTEITTLEEILSCVDLHCENNCSEESVPSQPVLDDEQGDDGFIDMEFFYISFGVCYTVVVMTIAAVLYINPYWRRQVGLYFIEDCIDTCYYFVVASFRKFSNFRR
nr:receptor-like protein 15 [Populus alba]